MTNDIKRRWRQNGTEYKPSRSGSKSFYNAIQKYGWSNFEHLILAQTDDFDEACRLEIMFIDRYDTTDKTKGYNISKGGNGGKVYKEHPRNMLGKSQTQYQKDHQREFMSDAVNNPMKNGSVLWGVTHEHPKGMKGKTHTQDHNKRISEIMKSRKINCKPVRVIYPNGEIERYDSTGDAQKIGLTKPVILKIIRSGEPYTIKVTNQYTDRVKHLEGIRIVYEDNTEITNDCKKR